MPNVEQTNQNYMSNVVKLTRPTCHMLYKLLTNQSYMSNVVQTNQSYMYKLTLHVQCWTN